MDRRNGRIFLFSYLLIYFAAPVGYIGVVQAALLNKLGTSATVANLPLAVYMLGQFAPPFFSWLVPHRLEQAMISWSKCFTASVLAMVLLTLVLPAPPWVRIGALIAQGLLQGIASSTTQVFMLQCLGRGTTLEGRARALKRTFTLGPFSAVAGSLAAQYILNPGIPGIDYPYDFALLYLMAAPAMLGVALLARGYRIVPLEEEARPPFLRYLGESARSFASSRPLLLLWFGYMLWYCAEAGLANLSLYTKEAMGRDPKEFSGVIMALRFGCKSAGGYLLGAIALAHGLRASVLTTTLLLVAGWVWGWVAHGYFYLFAFGLLGAGELGGTYFPNYALSLSPMTAGATNLSLVSLATPAASFAPTLHGVLTDRFGFPASFVFGILCAATAFLLVWRIPRAAAPKSGEKPPPR